MLAPILAFAAAQTPAQLTSPVEAPFRVTEDAIIVDAAINGKTISCMFDTGFGGHFVLSDQINIGPKSGTMTLRDFVGQFTAFTVKVKEIQLGQLKQKSNDIEAVMQPVAHMSESYGTHTDGIMGFSVIRDYVTEISFQKQRFIFYPRSTDITTRRPDNVKTFLLKMQPRGMNSVGLDSSVNGKPVHLALDTGNSFYLTTHKETLERVGLWDPNKKPQFMTQAYVASGPVDSFYVFVPEAKIFGVTVKDSVWDIIDLPSSGAEDDGTVGFGFLKNFNIIIDYERRYVWLENWTGKVTEETKGDVGIRIAPKTGGGYYVWHIVKGGPAESAGIKEKDNLLSVDGKSLSTVTPKGASELLLGKADSVAKLVISRDGIIQRLDVTRKLLVNMPKP
jgi:predicted aspartyl protease